MVKMSPSVCQRIRSAKSSLENAEQSFLDNKEMRGELDLMLAEAELSNLRRKKGVPWNWNRQILALCAAVLLGISCFSGWLYARQELPPAAGTEQIHHDSAQTSAPMAAEPVIIRQTQPAEVQVSAEKHNTVVQEVKSAPAEPATDRQIRISDTDMRRLVKSARVELTSSK